MTITTDRPSVDSVTAAITALQGWVRDDQPVPLHSGDVGWNWSIVGDAIVDVVRVWRRDGRVIAAALVDDEVIRLGLDPELVDAPEVGEQIAADCVARLRDGTGSIEARGISCVNDALAARGFVPGEPWTPLVRSLAEPVPDPGVRIEVGTPERAADRTAVHRAAFDSAKFTQERWHRMAAMPAYRSAKCLVAYADSGQPAAAITVWAAESGRPGLIEPMGVDPACRGHGFGRAITLAAAAALRDMGASSAWVCTRVANVGGVATYRSAGFTALPDVADLTRV